MGQLPQLLSRLFPFTRGLNHAYWAPNVWALVTALDRVLLKGSFTFDEARNKDSNKLGSCQRRSTGWVCCQRVRRLIDLARARWGHSLCSSSDGQTHPYLRDHSRISDSMWKSIATRKLRVNVKHRQIYMGKLWTNTSYKSFVTALTLCGFTSYMFGWHVHEKAILLVLVPLRYAIYR